MHRSCLRVMAYGNSEGIAALYDDAIIISLRSAAGLHSKQVHSACLQSVPVTPFLCGYMLTAVYCIFHQYHGD